jgi:hypothetical protein
MPRIPFVVYSDDGILCRVVVVLLVVLCYRVEMQFIRLMMWCLLIEAFGRMGKNPASFSSLSGLVDQVSPQRT